ncbi:hypothetical protein HYH03_015123 [Edaphochlamys debaryana]|uniref:Uncharacterized protein n=1 Tax=Edaphochlamys debaryana TaxID=47281 RepID=A0A836BST4_9CHLO|nr:hypothetical protein HYH03_015123 [Edaphochlamys debaryana]|eukprot:KAG2486159.1 hypothetical protein HYH03_015123 [Edaphochlamys debaryana]
MSTVSLKSRTLGSSAVSRPSRRGVRVLCAADNQLLKKPELKRTEGEKPKLFSNGAAAPGTTPAGVPAGGVTIEYQRQRAKEVRQYFIDLKNEELRGKSQVFGWTPSNEINNGRWVMFGFFVGMLTEYATGVDFVNQIALMFSYLGIVDLD